MPDGNSGFGSLAFQLLPIFHFIARVSRSTAPHRFKVSAISSLLKHQF
ncbi:MAG: hypothetical protein OJF50_004100 [Nitrospira sp.]|nr:hypothetical protein [Nitrospira sp.]